MLNESHKSARDPAFIIQNDPQYGARLLCSPQITKSSSRWNSEVMSFTITQSRSIDTIRGPIICFISGENIFSLRKHPGVSFRSFHRGTIRIFGWMSSALSVMHTSSNGSRMCRRSIANRILTCWEVNEMPFLPSINGFHFQQTNEIGSRIICAASFLFFRNRIPIIRLYSSVFRVLIHVPCTMPYQYPLPIRR